MNLEEQGYRKNSNTDQNKRNRNKYHQTKKKKTIILEISNAIQLKYIYVPFHPYEPLTMQSRSTNTFQNCN